MYGVIGSAVVLGIMVTRLMKKFNFHTIEGVPYVYPEKKKAIIRYLAGGSLFGLGWALTGACPGPMFTLLGNGFGVMALVIFSAVLGTFTYGLIRNKIPH
jgi:uncharacterized membrane protein YedE/YeeE